MTNEEVEAAARAIGNILIKPDDMGTIFDWVPYLAAGRAAIAAYEAVKGGESGTKSGTSVTVSDVQGPFSLGDIIEMTNPPKKP